MCSSIRSSRRGSGSAVSIMAPPALGSAVRAGEGYAPIEVVRSPNKGGGTMPYEDAVTGWVVTDDDDGFHDDSELGSGHPWWTETFWTSFNVPERRMGGWFYNQVLKNQGEHGLCNGGAWV